MARPGPAIRTIVIPVLALAAALSLGAWASGRQPDTRSSLTASLDVLPAETLVAGFTDWSAIRDELGVDRGSSRAARDALAGASLRDLTTRSVLGGVIGPMHAAYGWSAADLEWESYGQSRGGAAMVGRLSGSVSIDEIEQRLGEIGYRRDGSGWTLDEQGRTAVGAELASTLGHLAFVPRERLVVASDRPGHLAAVLATIRGRRDSVLSVRPAADVASALAGSTTAVVQAGAFGCRATSLDGLGRAVQAQAAAAIARTGRLTRPGFTGRGLTEGSSGARISFVAAFDSPAQAAEQLQVRSALAQGPFIGRSGRIEDTLELTDASTTGAVTRLTFTTDPSRSAYMSGEGPLLFASCP